MEELGLTKNEAAVYSALLETGITQAGPIIKLTGLHRMIVYNAFDSLIEQQLVSVLHKKNAKLFQPADPGILLKKASDISAHTAELVPKLRALQQKMGDLITTRTFIGNEGIATSMEEIIISASKTNGVMSIIGGAPAEDAYTSFGPWYPKYVELAKKYKVKKKLLTSSKYIEGFSKFQDEKNTELRVMDKGLSAPTYTRITPELVSIEMYHPQIVVIHIRNKAIAQSYLESFDLLWKSAKVIK